jgi:hypothetical protein
LDLFKTSGGEGGFAGGLTPRSIFDQVIYDPAVNQAIKESKNFRQFLTKLIVVLVKRGPGDVMRELDRLVKESSSVSDLIIRVILENLVPRDAGGAGENPALTEEAAGDGVVTE